MEEADAPGRADRPTYRELHDSQELDRAAFIHSIGGTLQAMVEEVVERQITRAIAPLRESLERHVLNEDAHVGKEYAGDRSHLGVLWDERNETRGMVKVLGVVAAAGAIAGPIVAVVIAKLWT